LSSSNKKKPAPEEAGLPLFPPIQGGSLSYLIRSHRASNSRPPERLAARGLKQTRRFASQYPTVRTQPCSVNRFHLWEHGCGRVWENFR